MADAGASSRETPRDVARALFAAGVAAVTGRQAVVHALSNEPSLLDADRPIRLLALGKASAAMTAGAVAVLGERIVDGLVISKHGHIDDACRQDARWRCLEASHPVPDDSSLRAGQAMLEYLADVDDGEQLLVLLSGGGSALAEAPVTGVDLDALQARTRELLANGAPIGEINRVRRGLSRLKGGSALSALGEAVPVAQLLISDVPGDELADIASGPFVDGSDRRPVTHRIVASNRIAREAVAAAAKARGYAVTGNDGSLDGDMDAVFARVATALPGAARTVTVFGGEPTLVLPDEPGDGGRNQHLAARLAGPVAAIGSATTTTGTVAAVEAIEVAVLVCGTDGTDGPTDAAGGCVVPRTLALGGGEAALAGALHRADSGPWLERAGARVHTGPTGTNVMDLAIVVRG